MRFLILYSFLFLSSSSNAQIISQFTWETNPVTTADIGPDATSVSGSATTDVGGVGGTRGLNAGTPKADINMIIPGSPTFDVGGIDVSFDFQREESQCDWVRRGNSLIMDGSNQFSVSYRVEDGMGGFNTVNSGNVFNIPNDDTYRNYRFIYLPVTGTGYLLLDGVVLWSNDGPDNRDMYWVGAGDMVIGGNCDGTGNNDTFMDNLIIGSVTNSGLPIELYEMTATANENRTVDVEWITKSETDNDYFTLERSQNGESWHEIAEVDGAGNSSTKLTYQYTDESPLVGLSYYRLKQTDFNGDFEYFEPVSVLIGREAIIAYPNPTLDYIHLDINGLHEDQIYVHNHLGQQMPLYFESSEEQIKLDCSSYSKGVYFIVISSPGMRETYRFVKD